MSKFEEWVRKREELLSAEIPVFRAKFGDMRATVGKEGVGFWTGVLSIEELLRLRDWITENFDEPKQEKL